MIPILHIYAQQGPHDEAYIVGNKPALLQLRRAISAALKNENGLGETSRFAKCVSAADGEGYTVGVIQLNEDFGGRTWNELLCSPYIGYPKALSAGAAMLWGEREAGICDL